MSVTGSASAAVEVEELQHLVGRLRRRAGYEQAVRYGLRGCAGALVVALLLVAGHRLFTIPLSAGLSATLVAIPLCFAAVASVLRWPTRADAARMADDLLGLEERLGTAVELLDGGYLRGTPLALLQLGDALAAGRDGVGRWPGFLVRIRRELVAVAILAPLVLGSLLLPHVIDGLGRSGRTPAAPAWAGAAAPPPGDETLGSTSAVPPSSPAGGEHNAADEQEGGPPPASSERRAALDELAEALGQMSASRGAADQLAQGDVQGAADQLAALGEQADQLSDAAKERLAEALEEAAAQTRATDPALAAAEQRAAQALQGSDYEEQRQALADLGREIARSGDGASGQAGAEPGGPQSGTSGAAEGNGQMPGQPGQDGRGTPGNTGDGPAGSTGQGMPGGSPGEGDGSPPVSGQPGQLDATGEQVEVPVQLLPGAASTRADAGAEPVGQQDGAAAGSGSQPGLAPGQQPTAADAERNDVPGDRRAGVRNYFDGDGVTGGNR